MNFSNFSKFLYSRCRCKLVHLKFEWSSSGWLNQHANNTYMGHLKKAFEWSRCKVLLMTLKKTFHNLLDFAPRFKQRLYRQVTSWPNLQPYWLKKNHSFSVGRWYDSNIAYTLHQQLFRLNLVHRRTNVVGSLSWGMRIIQRSYQSTNIASMVIEGESFRI